MLNAHGSYINDLPGRVSQTKITPDQAVEAILEHGDPSIWDKHMQEFGSLDPKDVNLMLNKTWVCLRVENGLVECLYNSDGTYYIYAIELPVILKRVHAENHHKHKTGLVKWYEKSGLAQELQETLRP